MTLELFLIIISGLLMAVISLAGGLAVWVKEQTLRRMLLPLVAFSAGSLLGGALFHMIPSAVEELGNHHDTYLWVAAGFGVFFCLEQFLHWHHCHRPTSEHHRPLTYLLLIADGVHNLIGGLAVGASFMVDIRLGITTWLVAAAHELPQELGDFGVLIYGGWSIRKALIYNFLSSLTFLVGALMAYAASSSLQMAYVVPFAAGNFLYIAAVDLVPEINKHASWRISLLHFACFASGLLLLLGVSHIGH